MRKAKIVATIGPASHSPERLRELMLAGMDVARVNMSHGTHESHAETIQTLRAVAAQLNRPLAILLDLSGPKIRTGKLKDGQPIRLTANQLLTITTRDVVGDETIVSTGYKTLSRDVNSGDRILFADGLIELRVEQVNETEVLCRVINGGELGEHKGINLPGVKLSAPSLTEKDRADLSFGLLHRVDYVALSFVRSAGDCIDAKALIASLSVESGADTSLIAKIEKREALEDLDAVIDACDGVMVARGDLGVETAVESVPFHQKQIIAKANAAEKLVITATQMLESMTHEPRPTRAEASDVANAILDGTDAVMLSAESAVGAYPVEAVATMARIIGFTEANCLPAGGAYDPARGRQQGTEGRAIAEAVVYAAQELNTGLIVVFSKSGKMARHLAALRPAQRVVVFTPLERSRNALAAVWGLEPHLLNFEGDNADLLARADEVLIRLGLAAPGETVVVMAGRIPNRQSLSSMMKLYQVGRTETVGG
ncbi:MAG TPA: pyruvate kinase [Blastocatellia bacterium]|nr:pyruvate kinase [Blastocatellia bacterium]HMV86509.1 pyruvate kinase [Blastocatellia bacterium]HMX27489.1 pyruvate kinase [Blastocatellia bacterium]HMY75330.1 pyruvate kinase [Blastocatellia bacterium]HMZ19928.1 pyruvate kinase [Blastocatellia bacterium]